MSEIHGRGASWNPQNRFESLEYVRDDEAPPDENAPRTIFMRDPDLLGELAAVHAASVFVSITTLDAELARVMEPRASTPELRLAALEALAKAGIPCGVMVAPVIPAITDHEMPKILAAAANAGAKNAGFVVLRLPWAVAPIFEK